MKNLKKVLAFVLVVAMMASLVISASALSAKDFTDYSEIVNKDAVAMLTELKVINGYPTGDYQPANVVTRAEMAKMIYTALMGGNDSAPVQKTNKYSDVWSGMWCEGYVAFCDELGIIAGYGDGTFGPNDPVTAVQAAKMLLVAMGYDAAKEGFVADPQWSYNILKVASAKGLFEGFTADTGAGCTRDNAALLIYNALKAENVTYVGTSAVNNGETLLGNVFGIEEVTGVVVANEYANLFGAEPLRAGYTEIALLGTHYIEQDQAIDPDYVVTNIKEAADYAITFVGELLKGDINLLGMTDKEIEDQVKLVLKNRTEAYDEKPGTSWLVEFNRREAVGAWDEYNTLIFKKTTELAQVGETVTVFAKVDANGEYTEAVVGNVLSDDDCVVSVYDGVDYEDIYENVDENTRYFVNYAMAWDTMGSPSRYWNADKEDVKFYNADKAITYNLPGETTKCIDVDGDGVVELVLKTRPVFTQAVYNEYYDSWYFYGYNKDAAAVRPAEIVSENGFEDGDFVLLTYIDGTYYIEKAASVEGIVEKVSYTEEDYPYVVLEDGTKLDESGLYWVNRGHVEEGPDACENTIDHTHFGSGRDAVTIYSYIADCDFAPTEYVFYLDAQGNVVGYTPKGQPMPQGKLALMTGSYIDGSKFEYALTYANEEGVTIYDVATNRFGDVEDADCDFFLTRDVLPTEINSGVLIAGTMFYKMSGYDTRVVNHMAYIKAQFDAEMEYDDYNLNTGKYGAGRETALVSISEKGEAVSASAATSRDTEFVALENTTVEADQYAFDVFGAGFESEKVYATSKTTFFVYEKVVRPASNKPGAKLYYEVNVYSFTGYKNLPEYTRGYINLELGIQVNAVNVAYAVVDSKSYEASAIVLEVTTDGKDYVEDMAFVLEVKSASKGFKSVKYMDAEGNFCTDTFCIECGEKPVVGTVYGIVECEHGYALVAEDEVIGSLKGNTGFFTTDRAVGGGEYFILDGNKYESTKDTAYYGIINVSTRDNKWVKAVVVKFASYKDFADATTKPVGVLWTKESDKVSAYNQVNAMIALVDTELYLDGDYKYFAWEWGCDIVEVLEVDHPVVVADDTIAEDPGAPAPVEEAPAK